MIVPVAVGLAGWELFWWARRRARRGVVYEKALAASRALGRPLLVVGAPDHGPTNGYGCGDMTTDIEASSSCPNFFRSDLSAGLPIASNSVVAFVACTLEYVSDPLTAARELQRVTGGWIYAVGVEPWTLTGWLYPGTRHVDATQKLLGQR